MKKKYFYFTSFFIVASFYGCDSHPKDKTNFDDIINCGFGKEYVSGYTKSNGTEIKGYCRNSNSISDSGSSEGFYDNYTKRYYEDSNEYEKYNNPDYGQ